MHATLGGEQTVSGVTGSPEGGGLDAGFLARAGLQELDGKAAGFSPAHEHTQEHLGPVLGVGATGARVDGDERVAGIVAPREETLLLQSRQTRLGRGDVLLKLLLQRGILRGHLSQPVEVRDIRLERRKGLQTPQSARMLRRDGRGALGVVPEPGRFHLGGQRRDAQGQPSRVKDNPREAQAAHGSKQDAAEWTPPGPWSCVHAIKPGSERTNHPARPDRLRTKMPSPRAWQPNSQCPRPSASVSRERF